MWVVKVYKDLSNAFISYTKTFEDEDDAYDFFEAEIKSEFDYEIENGLVSNQEIQNILSSNYYSFLNENSEILISIEENEED